MGRDNTYQIQEVLNSVYDPSTQTIKTGVTFSGDVEIGAVEIKNSTDDTRAVVGFANSAVVGSLALYVSDPTLIAAFSANRFNTNVQTFPSVSTVTVSAITGNTATTSLLAANASRKSVVVVNNSTASLYLQYSSVAATATTTYRLASQAIFDMPNTVYTGAIAGIWDGVNGTAIVTEL